MLETASFHIVKPCNMSCKFCYATFHDINTKDSVLSKEDCFSVIRKLSDAGLQKITFAGGEPLLYKHLQDAIIFSKKLGLTTSIITNGSLLTSEWMNSVWRSLDWVGLSVDSLNHKTNQMSGRHMKFSAVPDYYALVENIKHFGFKLKINTVVNRYNEGEDMQEFIYFANPSRWKIFNTLKVKGQNDQEFDEIKSSIGAFQAFVDRHDHLSMVVEGNRQMTGSYLLIDPLGRLFENSSGYHTYSDPLQYSTVAHCLSQINLDREMFIKRGGIYKW